MTSPSDWTFCWKLNAPITSNSQTRSKRKRPVSQNIPPTNSANVATQNVAQSSERNSNVSIMDNIKLPSFGAESWNGSEPKNAMIEPRSKRPARNSTKSLLQNHATMIGNSKQIRPVNSVGKPHKENMMANNYPNHLNSAGMMRVEIDLFPNNDFVHRNPIDLASMAPRNAEDFQIYDAINNNHGKTYDDDSLALALTPESGNSNISGDEYSPAVTPVSSSGDPSFLHFLNDDSLPLEICDASLSQDSLYGMELLPQELFNYDSSSWLSCFDP